MRAVSSMLFLLCCLAVPGKEPVLAESPLSVPVLLNQNAPKNPLAWDALIKKFTVPGTETTHEFRFSVTNTGPSAVTIQEVRPSCGCTIAKLPASPWILQPGENGAFFATINFSGKLGLVSKTLAVFSTAGRTDLTIQVDIPTTGNTARRVQNMELARKDKQLLFRQDCAKCHVLPAIGKSGEELYAAACAICHDAEHRAEMVPDLKALNKRTYPAYWKHWMMEGGPALMPSFLGSKGGFLSEDAIIAFAEFLNKKFPCPTVIKAANNTPAQQ